MGGRPPRWRCCTWRSRPPWKPGTRNMNPAPFAEQRADLVAGGRSRSSAARRPSRRWCVRPCPRVRSPTVPPPEWTPGGWRRPPGGSSPSWRSTGRPGRPGMSAAKPTANSAAPTSPPARSNPRSTCSSRQRSTGAFPSPAPPMGSANPGCCAAGTGPASTRSPAPTCTPPPGSWRRSGGSSTPPDRLTAPPWTRPR